MKYLLALIGEEGGMEDATPEQMSEVMGRWDAYTEELVKEGAFIAGEGLQPSSAATTLRVSQGGAQRVVTDGPFTESKEQLGGFYLLECKDLDEALEWAKKVPGDGGSVEVRPVMDYSQFGSEDPAEAGAASS